MGKRHPDARWLSWFATLEAATRSTEAIGREVEAATGLPLAWLEVLVHLEGEEGERHRMAELADRLTLSRGGLTRLVARMEDAGLVERVVPPEDRRATYAVMTKKGAAALD